MNKKESHQLKCDACQTDTPKQKIKYISLKTCCSVKRIPLCRECYQKFAITKGDKA